MDDTMGSAAVVGSNVCSNPGLNNASTAFEYFCLCACSDCATPVAKTSGEKYDAGFGSRFGTFTRLMTLFTKSVSIGKPRSLKYREAVFHASDFAAARFVLNVACAASVRACASACACRAAAAAALSLSCWMFCQYVQSLPPPPPPPHMALSYASCI